MRLPAVVWGASGHALVVADILRLNNEYEIVGFIDDVNLERHRQIFCDAPILGGQEQLDYLINLQMSKIIIAIGDCDARLRLADFVRAKGFELITAVHPRSTTAQNVVIGPGTVIAAGAVIGVDAQLGENIIVNTCASVDHECILDDGAHLSPGVHLGGRVVIGRGTWIGIGASIKDGVRIGAHSIIGAGSVVLHDIPDRVVATGAPATVIKDR
jgi:acetyltransferase EpsM